MGDFKLSEYLDTSRGRGFVSAISLLYAVTMAVVCLAMLLAKVLDGKSTVGASATDGFFIFHFGFSSLCIAFLLLWGARGKLTTDKHYKQQRSVVFILGGTLVLGTGGIIYESLRLGLYFTDPNCTTVRDGVHSAACVMFIVLQIIFLLNYAKIRINKSVAITCVGRLVMMQVIATNLCTWIRTIVWETEVEINSSGTPVSNDTSTGSLEYGIQGAGEPEGECEDRDELSHIIAPYTFPLLIEFCVAATTILMGVWEKCGQGHHHESPSHPKNKMCIPFDKPDPVFLSNHGQGTAIVLQGHDNNSMKTKHRFLSVADKRLSMISEGDLEAPPADNIYDNYGFKTDESASFNGTATCESVVASIDTRPVILFTQKNRKLYYNNHVGFVAGWVLLSLTIVVIIIYSYMIYSEHGYTPGLQTAIYTNNLTLCVSCIIAIPVTGYVMSKLSFKDSELKLAKKARDGRELEIKPSGFNVDKNLLYQTFVALLAFQILTMISAIDQHDYLIFMAGLSQLVFGSMQTIFINWFATNKRATKTEHFYTKPGRQGLEFLRVTNLSLWLVNTFLLENTEAKRVHWQSFGHEGWTILSNIFQPLTILYHFHAMVCFAEIIVKSYSSKYIGLQRPSKTEDYSVEDPNFQPPMCTDDSPRSAVAHITTEDATASVEPASASVSNHSTSDEGQSE